MFLNVYPSHTLYFDREWSVIYEVKKINPIFLCVRTVDLFVGLYYTLHNLEIIT